MQTGRLIPLTKSIAAVPVTVLGLSLLLLATSPAPTYAAETPAAPAAASALTLTYQTPQSLLNPSLNSQSTKSTTSTATSAPVPEAAPATASAEASAVTLTPAPPKALVKANGPDINLRSGPGTDYGVLGQIDPSDVLTVVETKGDWLQVQSPNGTGWVGKSFVSNCPTSLIGKLIVVDAGHGGEDAGALGISTRLKEKDVNLDVALRLGKMLHQLGAKVVFTREDDTFIPLYDRPALANQLHADLFVSIHADYTPKRTVSGTSTYYYQGNDPSRQSFFDRSIALAQDVQNSLISGLNINDRGVKKSPGIGFAVLRESQMPSILVETAFLSNRSDESKLRSPDFRQSTAVSITRGLVDFFDAQSGQQKANG